jgi:hypothetical protein
LLMVSGVNSRFATGQPSKQEGCRAVEIFSMRHSDYQPPGS